MKRIQRIAHIVVAQSAVNLPNNCDFPKELEKAIKGGYAVSFNYKMKDGRKWKVTFTPQKIQQKWGKQVCTGMTAKGERSLYIDSMGDYAKTKNINAAKPISNKQALINSVGKDIVAKFYVHNSMDRQVVCSLKNAFIDGNYLKVPVQDIYHNYYQYYGDSRNAYYDLVECCKIEYINIPSDKKLQEKIRLLQKAKKQYKKVIVQVYEDFDAKNKKTIDIYLKGLDGKKFYCSGKVVGGSGNVKDSYYFSEMQYPLKNGKIEQVCPWVAEAYCNGIDAVTTKRIEYSADPFLSDEKFSVDYSKFFYYIPIQVKNGKLIMEKCKPKQKQYGTHFDNNRNKRITTYIVLQLGSKVGTVQAQIKNKNIYLNGKPLEQIRNLDWFISNHQFQTMRHEQFTAD